MRQLKLDKKRKHIDLNLGFPEIEYTEKEISVLIHQFKGGDKEALKTFVRIKLRLIVDIAKKYQNHGLNIEELINEGIIGLINAAEKFNEKGDLKFDTYATGWICQNMINAIEEKKEGNK